MPRKLRIQYPGAVYHVMNRGDRREKIFADDKDREKFLETLGEACENYEQPSTRLTGIALPSGAYTTTRCRAGAAHISTMRAARPRRWMGICTNMIRRISGTNEVRADSSTIAYSYDNIRQLKIADSSVPTEDRGYTYDTAWNLNYRTNNGSLSTFLVDNKNQLTNSFVARNTYDSNGKMTRPSVSPHY